MPETKRTVAALLDFEEKWPRDTAEKDEAIRQTFGTTPPHYFALLNRAIDTDDAGRHNPILTHRLIERRSRNNRRRARMMRTD